MYYFFLDKLLLPVPPASITVRHGGNNKTYTLLNEGEVTILKKAKLQVISFKFSVPTVQQPYAMYNLGFLQPTVFLEYLYKKKEDKEPFQFIINRMLPDGTYIDITNITVSLEDFEILEDAREGFDFIVSIELKEYKEPFSWTGIIKKLVGTAVAGAVSLVVQNSRESRNSPKPKGTVKYTVKRGDTLWAIAKRYYGDGSKYTVIAKENKLDNPNYITVGQVLNIPKVTE